MFLVDDIAAGVALYKGVKSATGSGGKTSDQQRRDAEIATDLAKALAGDVPTAMSILDGRFHSIAYSKALCEQAWATIVQQAPDVATAALAQYQNRDPTNVAPSTMDKIKAEWNALVNKVKKDVADTAQRLGAGAATGAANTIDPKSNRVTLPLSSSMIWMVAIGVLAIAAIYLVSRKR